MSNGVVSAVQLGWDRHNDEEKIYNVKISWEKFSVAK